MSGPTLSRRDGCPIVGPAGGRAGRCRRAVAASEPAKRSTARRPSPLRQSTSAESALDVRPRNSPATRRLKGPGTVPSSIRPYMHTHRRADSCQRAAVLHRGWRVKARPALASGSEDVAAQVLVLHQLAQVLVDVGRSEEHTSELTSLMRISYAVFCLKTKKKP